MTEMDTTAITPEQRAALATAGWTEDDLIAFKQSLTDFLDGLPPRQRDALDAILATAAGAAGGEDVQGYLVVNAIIAVLIGLLPPATAPERHFSTRVL